MPSESRGATFSGPALAPFAYSQESHRGISGVKVVQLRGGDAVDMTPVQTSGDGDPLRRLPRTHRHGWGPPRVWG